MRITRAANRHHPLQIPLHLQQRPVRSVLARAEEERLAVPDLLRLLPAPHTTIPPALVHQLRVPKGPVRVVARPVGEQVALVEPVPLDHDALGGLAEGFEREPALVEQVVKLPAHGDSVGRVLAVGVSVCEQLAPLVGTPKQRDEVTEVGILRTAERCKREDAGQVGIGGVGKQTFPSVLNFLPGRRGLGNVWFLLIIIVNNEMVGLGNRWQRTGFNAMRNTTQ